MVCLGNICRSPMAEGILKGKIRERNLEIEVDSAGTGSWHAGENPDPRAISTAKKFGIDISGQVARQFSVYDFDAFDHIFAMDSSNLRDILRLARSKSDISKVSLILSYLPEINLKDVPDPWFGSQDGFTEVFNLLDQACDAVIDSLEKDFLQKD